MDNEKEPDWLFYWLLILTIIYSSLLGYFVSKAIM